MESEEPDQFDLYEGLENFEDSPSGEPEFDEQKEVLEEKLEVSAEEDEDDFNLVVDDVDAETKQESLDQKPVKKSLKPSIYNRKDRIFFVGAPSAGEVCKEPMSNIEFFVLVNNLPIWLDNTGLKNYVETITPGVIFCKVLYNFYNGTPLGIGFIEFAQISQCTTFINHGSQIISVPMPLQVFTQLQSCQHYREGVISESFIKSVCRHFSIPYSNTNFNSISQQDLMEIEFERQQGELVKNGEFDLVSKTFPWFNFDLISIMGNCNRLIGNNNFYESNEHFKSFSKSINNLDTFSKTMGMFNPLMLKNVNKNNPDLEKFIDRKSPSKKSKLLESNKKSDYNENRNKKQKEENNQTINRKDKTPERKDRISQSNKDKPKKRDRSLSRERKRNSKNRSQDRNVYRKHDRTR